MCLHQARWRWCNDNHSLGRQPTPNRKTQWAHGANKIRFTYWMGDDWPWWTNQDHRCWNNPNQRFNNSLAESICWIDLGTRGAQWDQQCCDTTGPNIKLVLNPDGNKGNRSNSFARLLGELQFLANSTWLDITFAVNQLAAYTVNPSLQHFTALKQILRYLAGTKNLGITYSKTADNPDKNIFHGFADAAFTNHDDHKSTSGYVFLAAGGAITWKSKKQTTIALSSTQASVVF